MTTALLLVDVQQDFFARPHLSPRPQDLIDRLSDLLKHCRTMGLPILHVRTRIQPKGTDRMPHWQHQETWACVAGTPGYEPPEDLDTLPGEQLLHKSFFSAFSATDLQPELEKAGITDLIIAGLYTHGCIRATVLDAYERGFRVWVADDAIGSTEPVHASITCSYLNGRAAVFMPSADLLERATATNLGTDTEMTRFHQLHTPRDDRKPGERVNFASQAAVNVACENATVASKDWSETKPEARAMLLDRWAELLERKHKVLQHLLAKEIGKPLADVADELRRTLAHIQVAARMCCDQVETIITESIRVRYRPLGTIALITPWNNPLAIPAGKLAPALAFGNSCVWKPAPQAPGCARLLLETLIEAGLPEGVVELIHGDAATGRQLVVDDRISAVSVTGSVDTGSSINILCSTTNKPLQAELGGNNAAIILNDWQFDDAELQTLAMAVFGFSGQRCTATRRLIVHRDCIVAFTYAFARVVSELRIGDPLEPATQIGPLISREHRDNVRMRLDEAIAGGARIVAQASLPDDLPGQCWLTPVLLDSVDPTSPIVQNETFGPVAIILPATDLDDAIDIANAVPQGLVASLYSNDAEARLRFESRTKAGMLSLAPGPLAIHPEAPFTGWKASAIGPPEHGIWDRDFYAKPQVLYGLRGASSTDTS